MRAAAGFAGAPRMVAFVAAFGLVVIAGRVFFVATGVFWELPQE